MPSGLGHKLRRAGAGWSAALLLTVCACSGGGSENQPADMAQPKPDPQPMVDAKAPTFAGLATALPASTTAIDLSWAAAQDDRSAATAIRYQIYMASASLRQNFSQPSFQAPAGATTYQVTGLDVATRYFFVVRARDEANNTDTNLIERSATTLQIPDTKAPTFGGLLTATPTGNTVTLAWDPATDDLAAQSQLRYAIFVRKMTGSFDFNTPTVLSPPGVSNYTVTGLDAQTAYAFVVRAQDPTNNRETNTTEKSATTGVISFTGQVQPIFASSCGGGNCHSGAMPKDGLDLSSAASSYAALVSKMSSICVTETRVVPSMPDKSYLIWKLIGMGSGTCYQGSRMPPGGMLSAGDMNTVRGWISAGAMNN
jgi:hypothetical protein